MRWLLCLCLLFSAPQAGADRSMLSAQVWVVEKNSKLVIEGSSNINSFTCEVMRYLHNDTLDYVVHPGTRKLQFRKKTVTIDVAEIDCHHKFITADLRKTLRFQEYPYLKIHFVGLDDPAQVSAGQPVKGTVDIEIAGKVKRIDMVYNVKNQGARLYHFSGSKALVFSDFQLSPPKKLAGLIRINEELKVNVQLYFRKIG